MPKFSSLAVSGFNISILKSLTNTPSLITFANFKIDVVSLNTKNWKIGKTLQKKLNAGRSKETNKKSKNEEKEKKVRILNLEVATSLVGLILGHSKEDRDFDCFATDACHIFSSDVVENIGKKEMENLWKVFENCIVNLAFRC